MDIENRFHAALEYLNSFVDYSLVNQKEFAAAKFELHRVSDLARSLGDPQQKYPSIHVAGSKGKGSVSALCAAALQAQGYRVGLYTSPHLVDFEERIQVDRQMISKEELVQFVEEIKPYVAAVPGITTFEIITVLAFWYFARKQVDVAVIEVGLGGRLDATNIVSPNVSVITALFLEHTLILGDTLAKIAAEKGGIIKSGVPVVLAPQKEEARQVIAQIASQRNAPLVEVERDYAYTPLSATLEGQTFAIRRIGMQRQARLTLKLLGLHQVENAAVAYAALKMLDRQGVKVTETAIRRGFALAKWPARFEILRRDPFVIIDGAHTPDAAQRLRQAVVALFPGMSKILVFGVSEDKNVRDMIAELLPNTAQVICTRSPHPRAMPVEALLNVVHPFGVPARAIPDVGEAVAEAENICRSLRISGMEAIVLVTGSLFVAGKALESLK